MFYFIVSLVSATEFVPFENATNGCVDTAVRYAFAQKGKGYSMAQCTGAAGQCCRLGPKCFDCSGLVYMAYKKAGKKVPGTTYGYPGGLKSVGVKNAKPGDLLWNKGHVGMVGYNGQTIHAANPKDGVVVLSTSVWIRYNYPTHAYRIVCVNAEIALNNRNQAPIRNQSRNKGPEKEEHEFGDLESSFDQQKSLSTVSDGNIAIEWISTGFQVIEEPCHDPLKEGDIVVMEVNMESNPRTVQFFVNGKAGKGYVAGIPESMRVVIQTYGEGTSFRWNIISYTLVRPISEGAFGRVLEIKELSTGKSYALKLIPRLTEADQKRAEREVSLLERFRHSRIVGLHESFVMETYHGIVMDLGKRNLKDLMMDFESRNELIPLEVAVMICIDIAEGLSVMHNHPTNAMAHGDLKPENVLLSEDNRAVLCDLGAADASGVNVTRSASEVETCEYNSPERCEEDDAKGTPASDVWSLGVMLCRMVTGQALFSGKSTWKLMQAIMDFDESKLPTNIPDDVRVVLVKMLEPNPASRVTSTQLFDGRQLERILGPETPLSKMKDLLIQSASRKPKQKSQYEQNPNISEMKEEQAKHQALLERNKNLKRDLELATPETTRECVAMNTIGNSKKDSGEDTARQTENERNEELRNQDVLSAMLPSMWPRTESITSFDSKAHKLTGDCVVQTVKLGQDWRTVFTFGLIAGEWELSIRGNENPLSSVLLSFLRFPLPDGHLQKQCGTYDDPIGGDFDLSNGRMWRQGKELKPAGTNKACTEVGQTASIRVDLSKREARLVVDGVAQPGIFENIPCQVCLGMSTGYGKRKSAVEIIHLRRLNASLIRPKLTIPLNTPTCFFGTSSFSTFNPEYHTITTTTVIPKTSEVGGNTWRTVLTRPITQGVWELKIRARYNTFRNFSIGFLKHPPPSDATEFGCGYHRSGIGADFLLFSGKMWQSGKEFKPEGTNRRCNKIGHTAAIRVNITRKEATLFVDDEEQPGIFTGNPRQVVLGNLCQRGQSWNSCRSDMAEASGHRDAEASHEHHSNVVTEHSFAVNTSTSCCSLNVTDTRSTRPIEIECCSVEFADTAAVSASTNSGCFATDTVVVAEHGISERTERDDCDRNSSSSNDGFRFTHTDPNTADTLEVAHDSPDVANSIHAGTDIPLPDKASLYCPGQWPNGIGGDFVLWSGRLWKDSKEFRGEGTNKKCDKIGQTAAIRVNLSRREARLFVDDSEQPGIFTDIPESLCLSITTCSSDTPVTLEIVHLRQLSLAAAPRTLPSSSSDDLPESEKDCWLGTSGLQLPDHLAHTLFPSRIEHKSPLPVFFTSHTFPIAEGEWELMIRTDRKAFPETMLSFLSLPHPFDRFMHFGGFYKNGIGGSFDLRDGAMTRWGGLIRPNGTNRKCLNVDQTAAIRVNLENREARLVVDGVVQPGIFTDIPSPITLSVSTLSSEASIKVVHMRRLDGKRGGNMIDVITPNIFPVAFYNGTLGLEAMDYRSMRLTPTHLIQLQTAVADSPWRTAFTEEIISGEYELKVRLDDERAKFASLEFVVSPLPENATQFSCGNYLLGLGSAFHLWNGRMWRLGKEFKPAGTNKKCDQVGQTAMIRVDMEKREARLFIDDEEQPGIFTNLPIKVRLAVATNFHDPNVGLEVLHFRRVSQAAETPAASLKDASTPWKGTSCIRSHHQQWQRLEGPYLAQIVKIPSTESATAVTFGILEGEWELKIKVSHYGFTDVDLGYIEYPPPHNINSKSPGLYIKEEGAHFRLQAGLMRQNSKVVKLKTPNTICNKVGQTAAIRVNMRTREARLFVDDVEQPNIFKRIPRELALTISTNFTYVPEPIYLEVLGLKRLS
ncbi:putative Cyclin-dependent kinase 2 [Blattamonas nauphoetae]|uniref:non-specific serine/threonine protein kinase n=1 Tax=Blattamonas nauphoetae TaxID=2049346 RepID=A0ABQ9XBG2_9EUKA|nr:putative Cyclin-dependent kinase 2 [Blattamonas nauphoetae]